MCPGASWIKPGKTIQMRFGRGTQEQGKGNEKVRAGAGEKRRSEHG